MNAYSWYCVELSYQKRPTNKCVVVGGADTKPSVGIISHGVEVIPAHSAGASSGHRQWYGLKPPAAMVSGNRDVSCETEAKRKGGQASLCTVHFIHGGQNHQPLFQDLHWSNPRINFMFVIHKCLFVFVHAICLCAVTE